MAEETSETCSVIPTPEQKLWECLCYLCYPKAKEYCELIEGCWLFENEGRWGLMCQPGHQDDHAILFFPDKPWPDPDPACEHEGDEIAALNDKWIDTVTTWEETVMMSPTDGHFLVEACKQAGWSRKRELDNGHPIMLQWLYNFAGKKLRELECGHEPQSDHRHKPAEDKLCDAGEPQAEGPLDDGGRAGSEDVGLGG